MVIAVYGPSCTGKTSVARVLAGYLDGKLRSCGERIKERAEVLNVGVDQVSIEVHEEIDLETQEEVAVPRSRPFIVEGRFLDAVLWEFDSIDFVELSCDYEERQRRWSRRSKHRALSEEDAGDASLRNRLFSRRVLDQASALRRLHVDTTDRRPVESVEFIVGFLSREKRI